MTIEWVVVLGLGASVCLMLIGRDWRPTLVGLACSALAVVVFVWITANAAGGLSQPGDAQVLVGIELTAAVSVLAIAAITALTLRHDTRIALSNEPDLLEVHEAVQRVAQALPPSRWRDYVVRGVALVVVLIVAVVLPRFSAVEARPIDTGWLLLLAGGIALVMTATTLPALGTGLLVLVLGTKLLLLGLLPRIEVLHLVLLSFVSILLAVVLGYLSRMLNRYDETLALGALLGDEWSPSGDSEPASSSAHE